MSSTRTFSGPCSSARRSAAVGPKGRNVVLEKKWGAPTITNDGVSVAKEIELEGPWEKIGAQKEKAPAAPGGGDMDF
jgi:hypothetical protein